MLKVEHAYHKNYQGCFFKYNCRYPTTTGTSVLAVKFSGGIVMAADMLGSYGSLARYKNISRLLKVNNSTVVGGGGDYADFQHICRTIQQKV